MKCILKVIWGKKLCALACSLWIYSPLWWVQHGGRSGRQLLIFCFYPESRKKGLLLLSSLFSYYWFQNLSLQKGATHKCRWSHLNLSNHGNSPEACPETGLLGGSTFRHIEYIGRPGHWLLICKLSVVLDVIDIAWLRKSKMFIT